MSQDEPQERANALEKRADGIPADDAEAEALTQRERYRELLEELRTILPGVQVLLAFLLTAPFAARFPELEALGRLFFGLSVFSAALATVLFMAPTSYHRLTRSSEETLPDRRRRIRFASRATVAGMAALSVSVVAALLLVTQFVFGLPIGILLASAVLIVVMLTWYLIPIRRRPRS